MNAQYILDKCRLNSLGVPAMTTGDGNCLFNAASIALTGHEKLSPELRMRTTIEMAINSTVYTNRGDFEELMNHSPTFDESLNACYTEGASSSIWAVMALSSVLGVPIASVYPPMNGTKFKTHLSLTKRFSNEENDHRETLNILWSRMGPWRPPTWTGNLFVPVIKIQTSQPQLQPVKKDQPKQHTLHMSFKPMEINKPHPQISTPVHSSRQELKQPFVVTDKSGNEIKVTPLKKHDTTTPGGENDKTEVMEPSLIQEHELDTSFEFPENALHEREMHEKMSDTEDNITVDVESDQKPENALPESEIHENMSDTEDNLTVDDESDQTLPVPKNVNPFPQGKWQTAGEIYNLIKEKKFIHNDVPPGNKSNCNMLVDNVRNVERVKMNKHCEFFDGCGVWVSKQGRTLKQHYYIEGGSLFYCESKNGQYCTRKKTNGKTTWVSLEPQPSANWPLKNPKEIYAALKRDDSMTCARDFRVVKNVKYEQKRKEKTERVNRLNIADEILEVLGMVNDHPFVQSIIHNKDQVPNVICYTNEQIIDLKHFVRNSNNQAIGIDRTFNLGNYYVTTLVYKNQRVVRKESTKTNKHDNQDLPAQPIFLGPVLLHKDATYKTYKSFLEHIKTELESDIEAVELRLPESIEFGTDDEKALTKAIDNVFPSSIRVLCTKHLKDNVKHYLQNRVGMEQPI